jgi:hypothetical protein
LNDKPTSSSGYLTFGGFTLTDKKGTSWISKGQKLSLSIFAAKFSKVPPLYEIKEKKYFIMVIYQMNSISVFCP